MSRAVRILAYKIMLSGPLRHANDMHTVILARPHKRVPLSQNRVHLSDNALATNVT